MGTNWILIQHPYDGAHEAKVYYDMPKKEVYILADTMRNQGCYVVVVQAIKYEEFGPREPIDDLESMWRRSQ